MLGDVGKRDRQRLMLERALKIAEEQDYKLDHLDALCNLGVLYYSLGNIEFALFNLSQAEKEARSIRNSESLSHILYVTANCLRKRGNYIEAIEKSEESYKIYPEPENQLHNFITLGLIYSMLCSSKQDPKRKDYFQKSKIYFERGMQLAVEQRDPRKIFVCTSIWDLFMVISNTLIWQSST